MIGAGFFLYGVIANHEIMSWQSRDDSSERHAIPRCTRNESACVASEAWQSHG
jgi:hypothetical protein